MKKLMIAALVAATAVGSYAKDAGFQLSLTPDIAIQDRDTNIKGVSIGVWNENPGSQWQIGFVNGTTGDASGLQGLFIYPLYSYAENYTGAQISLVNYASGEFVGLQWGAVNIANNLTGAQLGIVNYAGTVDGGFQWGLVNYAETTHNLFQLGLANIMVDNNWFTDFPNDLAKGFVFVNWSFGDK
ncbi:hypothetical protein P4C99_04570 [Pontiellaceae bacterium B1224]|nr:hypothetical protein [Pontiellaceae bacterium B1224]